MYTIFLGKSCQHCGWSKGVGIGWRRHGGSCYFVYWKIWQLKPLWAQGGQKRNPVSAFLVHKRLSAFPCSEIFAHRCHVRLCDPQLVWSRMSSPEKLIKTLHKRKVAPQNQYYRVHYHHRHRHHRRQPHHHKATLHKRGWGRLAELGETYYEHLVADDNVGSVPTLLQIDMVQLSYQVSIKSLKHDKHFWELFTSKEEFRVSIIQVGRYLLFSAPRGQQSQRESFLKMFARL